MYVIAVQMEYVIPENGQLPEWSGSRQLPTFYVEAMSESHAIHQAENMLSHARLDDMDNVTFHITAVKL